MSDSVFISTTIPYVNGRPHLGHAFEFVEADAFARFYRQQGNDVFFLTGSDENSLKNVIAAEKENIPVRQLVDRNVVYFQQLVSTLGLSNDYFIRTSHDIKHSEGASLLWKQMVARGDIYSKSYTGLYCVGCEQFYTEDELVDGKCPEHLVAPEHVSEENYFFRLSRYQEPLLEALTSGHIRVVPESRLNEIVSFVRSGLSDISVSRSTERARGWGIPVPGDNRQVMYVWIDALTNYITALGWANNDPEYVRYWQQSQKRIHVVGKGVIRFHAVYWPAMLMSASLPLPTDIFVHSYITTQGQKLSKSLGNSVDPQELLNQYGAAALRYYLLADVSPFRDGDFSEERLVTRYNSELANELGNLVNRVASMLLRYRDGTITEAAFAAEAEIELEKQVLRSTHMSIEAMVRYDHRDALAKVWELVRRVNAYIDEKEPWHQAKVASAGDEIAATQLDTTLYYAAAAVRKLGELLLPFLPEIAKLILRAFGTRPDAESLSSSWLEGITGVKVEKLPLLFPRMEIHSEWLQEQELGR